LLPWRLSTRLHLRDRRKADQQIEEWQDAVEALLLVVKSNGPMMLARIGVMRALNRHELPNHAMTSSIRKAGK
jgi:hypothetical protein